MEAWADYLAWAEHRRSPVPLLNRNPPRHWLVGDRASDPSARIRTPVGELLWLPTRKEDWAVEIQDGVS